MQDTGNIRRQRVLNLSSGEQMSISPGIPNKKQRELGTLEEVWQLTSLPINDSTPLAQHSQDIGPEKQESVMAPYQRIHAEGKHREESVVVGGEKVLPEPSSLPRLNQEMGMGLAQTPRTDTQQLVHLQSSKPPSGLWVQVDNANAG
ncbi:PREDICTED: uncharacterized protein LOC104599775 [Nelumbo nucifera]|uniref:Uncharacterized protein LOC104599775 n=1 Tax=Nelumbo nucifera TaxID=4432 RepID=A0A1U8A392_NELNU|nr:PREDICTED: uncharacterized protein LOC104599775 [Nelumbo nucifera]